MRTRSKGAWRAAIAIGAPLVIGGAPALAQPVFTYELRTRFTQGWSADGAPVTEPVVITAPGRYDFQFQEGVFDAQGFTNFGLANWIGRIVSSEPLLSRPSGPRISPFDGIGNDGSLVPGGTVIGRISPGYQPIDAARAMVSHDYDAAPPPPAPGPYGAEEFVGVYRFSIEIADVSTARDILIRAEDLAGSRPLQGWFVIQDIPPDPDTGRPGMILYAPHPLPTTGHAMTARMTLRIAVPGPGGGAAVVIGLGVLGTRRRR